MFFQLMTRKCSSLPIYIKWGVKYSISKLTYPMHYILVSGAGVQGGAFINSWFSDMVV